jgi:hypothetical protein
MIEAGANGVNLNLLSSTGLKQAAAAAGLSDFRIMSVSLFGWPTNLLLLSRRL